MRKTVYEKSEVYNVFDISKLDGNFAVKSNIGKCDVKFYNVDEYPFKIYGIYKEDGKYRRMPEKVAKNVSEGV